MLSSPQGVGAMPTISDNTLMVVGFAVAALAIGGALFWKKKRKKVAA